MNPPRHPPLPINPRAQGLWEARAVGEPKRTSSKRAFTPTAQITQNATNIDLMEQELAYNRLEMRTLLETVEQLLETVDDLKAEVSDLRAEVDAPKARAHRMTTRSTVKRNIGSGIVKRLRKRRK